VLGRRKRLAKPWDLDSAAQYLVDCKKFEGIRDVDLLRYSKALGDPTCLRIFLAIDSPDEKMEFIKSSAVSSKGLFGNTAFNLISHDMNIVFLIFVGYTCEAVVISSCCS
jgi:hypothetical protein